MLISHLFSVSVPLICCFHLLRLSLPHWKHLRGKGHFTRWDGENAVRQRIKAEEILELRCAVVRVEMR